ncbi:DUF58 domain-containing protein [Nocardioides sp. B-3]|uniref:DUF58 domain-containing protein n=1 Tax=Nocardioides sp. B-3 TaxID=2895565 RepID=UPI0021524BAD|nr:DUF58 domain-containing protein [Nocardioides sp. B-3]UUZ58175.1 DUF58 domain-containing protein [Nocardioides sp. B-3]
MLARVPNVSTRPAWGAVSELVGDEPCVVELGPRRWGRPTVGDEQVALTSSRCGYRYGAVRLTPQQLTVWPQAAAYDSTAEAPQPDGLVGAHRSRRVGSGTEFAGIRPFAPGDRLRRISWPVSLRTRELQVVTTRAEQDTSVLIVVDALRDIGVSGGIDGRASSLDLTVRAASALADHHVRRGDRVGMRVVGPGDTRVPFGSGPRHLHRITGTLTRIVADTSPVSDQPLELGVTGGSVVYVLSTMLHGPIVNASALLSARGVSVVVIDTLGERSLEELGGPTSPAGLAWRMRMIERADLLQRLAAIGCPIVPPARPRHRRRGAAPAGPARTGAPCARDDGPAFPEPQPGGLSQPRRRAAARRAAGRARATPALMVVLVLAGSLAWAVLPELAVGPVVLLAVMAWWAVKVPDPVRPTVLVAAPALSGAHVAGLLAAYGPVRAALDRRLVLMWVRRTLLGFLVAPVAYAAVVGLDEDSAASMWPLAVGVLAVLCLIVGMQFRERSETPTS